MGDDNGTAFRTKYVRHNGAKDWPAIWKTVGVAVGLIVTLGSIGTAQVKMNVGHQKDIERLSERQAELAAGRKEVSDNINALLKYGYDINEKLNGKLSVVATKLDVVSTKLDETKDRLDRLDRQ